MGRGRLFLIQHLDFEKRNPLKSLPILQQYFGIQNWDWGSSGFTFQSEGWFGTDTKYGGMDKLGHAYTGYVVSQYFTQRIAHSVDDPANAAITGVNVQLVQGESHPAASGRSTRL